MTADAKSKSSNTVSQSTDKTKLIKRTTAYVTQFINGNFDAFYKDCTKQLQQQITAAQLKQSWDSVLTVTGKPGKSISCTYSKQGKYLVLQDTIDGTLFNITVAITYDSKGKPAGIWTSYSPKASPKPQTSDKWKEASVTVGEMKLPGMLTLPKGVDHPPVVLLIQGSGPSDMNEAVGITPNRPFEDIAHGLAEQGVATLRYNKRTYQYPATTGADINSEILDDAAAAVKLLSSDTRVDSNRIYLLGHSLGGMMAPKITADNPEIKGFISMAGSLRHLEDIVLDQNKAVLDGTTTLTDLQKASMLMQVETEIKKVKTLDDGGTNSILGIPTSYWKSLNAIDSTDIAQKLKVPMLILQGSADFQVYPDKDYQLWQSVLKDHTNVTYHLYDGLSHEFMPNQISKNNVPDVTVYNAPNHVSSQVISDIAAWVKGL